MRAQTYLLAFFIIAILLRLHFQLQSAVVYRVKSHLMDNTVFVLTTDRQCVLSRLAAKLSLQINSQSTALDLKAKKEIVLCLCK